jgi:tetrahydrodipicolinate N-succinyltransferase
MSTDQKCTDAELIALKEKVDETAKKAFQVIREAAIKEFPNDKQNAWLFASRCANAVWVVINPQLVPILNTMTKDLTKG